MVRWEPDSRRRLHEAAMALYGERGFDNTTVAEIAERAGLTERTFFRHFADKREVLFAGAAAMEEAIVGALAKAPADLAPLDAVAVGLEAAGTIIPDDPELSRQRQAIIAASAELQERELMKLAALSAALAGALRARGLSDAAASLTAEVGIAVFKTAVERWAEAGDRDLAPHVREALGEVRALAGAS